MIKSAKFIRCSNVSIALLTLLSLDKLDVAILRELTQAGMVLPARPGTGPSYRELSRTLGVAFGTIRNRISAMYSSGALIGSSVFPNPNLLGLKFGAFNMEVSPLLKKAEVMQKLRSVEGVIFMHDFIGSRAWVGFFYEDEADLERKLKLYGKIAGKGGYFSDIPYPSCPDSVSRPEARLILRLLKKGLGSYAELARDLGIPVRTLKRKMSMLLSNGSILSLPNLNYRAIEGAVPADLIVFFESEEIRASAEPKILETVKDCVVFAGLFDVVGLCSLIVPKVGTLTELAEKVRKIEGIKQVWAEVVDQHIDQINLLGEYVEKRLLRGHEPILVRH